MVSTFLAGIKVRCYASGKIMVRDRVVVRVRVRHRVSDRDGIRAMVRVRVWVSISSSVTGGMGDRGVNSGLTGEP